MLVSGFNSRFDFGSGCILGYLTKIVFRPGIIRNYLKLPTYLKKNPVCENDKFIAVIAIPMN